MQQKEGQRLKNLTAEPDKRPNILRLSVFELSRIWYICFASEYPIAKRKICQKKKVRERKRSGRCCMLQ